MKCGDCKRGYNCQFHRRSGGYAFSSLKSGLTYGKLFLILNPSNMERISIRMRPVERIKAKAIEIDKRTSTCRICRELKDCTVFVKVTEDGQDQRPYCNNCIIPDKQVVMDLFPEYTDYR